MAWTHFHDMHSGGGQKLDWAHIFIEAPEDEAKRVFRARLGRNPERVTCTCCGADYSISEAASLEAATAYYRGCEWVRSDGEKGGGHYAEHGKAEPRSYDAPYQTLEQFLVNGFRGVFEKKGSLPLIIRAAEILPEWRTAELPAEGYVWVGDDE